MKILAIGDFHGKFPKKLQQEAKKADLIISTGDYLPWTLKNLFMKHYKEQITLNTIISEDKYIKSHLNDLKKAEKILQKLNKLNKPIITTVGNYDTPDFNDTFDKKEKDIINKKKLFLNLLKKFKNIKRADYRAVKFKELVIIGAFGHSYPGRVKSKAYKKHKQKLEKLFKKYSKENKEKRVIFLSHNAPYNCKLDIIRDKNAPEIAQGEHYGSKLVRKIIDKYQPFLAISGHFHENQGKTRIKKTLVINPGAALENKAALIEINTKTQKIKKIRFINP